MSADTLSVEDLLELLPKGSSIKFLRRRSGIWLIQRSVFPPAFFSGRKVYNREGRTLREALAAPEVEIDY